MTDTVGRAAMPPRLPCVVALLMVVAVGGSSTFKAQDTEVPVFRSDTNALSFEFGAVMKRGRGGKDEPLTTLARDDIKIVIDRKEYAPTSLTQDKPGHYAAHLVIPDAYRDGKTHKVRFKVKKSTFPFTHTFTIPNPSLSDHESDSRKVIAF